MSRRVELLLIAGCVLVALLELPSAVRSVEETWRGPYALDGALPADWTAERTPLEPGETVARENAPEVALLEPFPR